MKPKSTILLTTVLVAMAVPAVWLASNNDLVPPDPAIRRSGSHRDRQADRQEASRSKMVKPVRELSTDDLLNIYNREGAAAALAAAKSQPWPNRDRGVFFILSHLGAVDPQFAAAELKASGLSAFLKFGVVDTILKNWKDGRKALDWAENQLTGELRCQALAVALGILVKSESDAAFDFFEKMPPGEARRRTVRELFSAWGSHDPEAALMRANELTPADARSATEHVLRGWAKTDPATAAAWVLKTAPTDGTWLAGVYQSWISISPEQAKVWFDSLPEGDAKKEIWMLTFGSSGTLTMSVLGVPAVITDDSWASKPIADRDRSDLINWAIQNTDGARAFVEQNGNSPVSKQLACQVAMAIADKNGPSVAMDWALGLPIESDKRMMALDTVLLDWFAKDPEAVGVKLAATPPEQSGKLPHLLVNIWVVQDPVAAADWVAGWKCETQKTMIEHLIDKWPNQDPEAAYQWLGTLPSGAGRDAGISRMIIREWASAPDTLQPWIDLISDPQLREKTRRDLNDQMKSVPHSEIGF